MSAMRRVGETTPPNHNLLTYLPFAGALPFIFGALMALIGIGQIVLPIGGSFTVDTMVAAYALAILSFMAGVHWGQYLAQGHNSTAILVISNVITVVGWLAMLTLAQPTFLIVAAISFLVLLLVDRNLFQSKVISKTYFRIRLIVTLLVAASLILTALI